MYYRSVCGRYMFTFNLWSSQTLRLSPRPNFSVLSIREDMSVHTMHTYNKQSLRQVYVALTLWAKTVCVVHFIIPLASIHYPLCCLKTQSCHDNKIRHCPIGPTTSSKWRLQQISVGQCDLVLKPWLFNQQFNLRDHIFLCFTVTSELLIIAQFRW